MSTRTYTITTNTDATSTYWNAPPKQAPLSAIRQLLSTPDIRDDKDGLCFIPGEFQGNRRSANAMMSIDMLVYDVDGHQTLQEALEKLGAAGVYAIVYTTFSHRTNRTLIHTNHYDEWAKKQGLPSAATKENVLKYLDAKKNKGHLKNVEFDPSDPKCREFNAKGLHIVVHHDPLDKFRVVLPLASPIPVATLSYTTKQSIAEWKSIYHGVGQALGLAYDPACEDPSRVHYMPACSKSNEDKFDVFQLGDPNDPVLLDWTKYPRVKAADKRAERGEVRRAPRDATTVTDKNGVPIDLVAWERDHANFDIETCLETHLAAEDLKDPRAKGGFHITCPNEADHSEPGGLGCFAANRDEEHGWTINCRHAGCAGRNRLDHLRALIEQGVLTAADIGYAAPVTVADLTSESTPEQVTSALLTDAADKAALTVSYNSDTQSFDAAKRFVKGLDGKLTPVWTLLASPIIIDGVGYTDDHKEATLILRIRTETGRWNRIAIPRSELTGGPQLMSKLKGMGLRTSAPAELVTLLSVVEPSRQVVTAKQPGWSGEAFVLPSGEVIGSTDVVPVFEPVKGFEVAGSRDGADAMLTAIEHQSRLVFAVAASLAAPLYTRHGIEPGGVNLAGKSSGGKTTTLAAALSMWGRGDLESRAGLIGSANTTAFAAEVRAAKVNNLVMSADEIKTASPETVETLLYTIPNGASRAAGRADGGLREQRQFSVMLFLTGEMTTRAYLEQHKIPYNAGMAVRILDIPADAGAGHGVFDSVPDGFSSAGALADWLKEQARTHYGHHGRAVLESYLDDTEAWTRDLLEASLQVRRALDLAPGVDPQIGRVASRVAFIGSVASVAARRGIVPWRAESVVAAVSRVFADWVTLRGGSGSLEVIDAERAFTNYIQTNPGAFDIRGTTSGPDRRRCGVKSWYEADDGKRYPEYLIHSEESFVEMLGGQAERLEPFLTHLKSGGSDDWAIRTGAGRDKIDSPKGLGLPKRCYCIRSKQPQDIELDEASNDNKTPVAPATCFG